MSLGNLGAAEAAALIESGEISPEALVRACLDRIQERDPQIRAFVCTDRDKALEAASRIATRAHRGPLHGIPFAVKDVIETRDLPTEYGSDRHRGLMCGRDAAAVSLTRAAGAILVGKTHTVEFAAAGRVPPTRNPRDLARTPGGSSSGSAAAVAAGMVPIALGTQTGGSVIRPASFTGIYGMKPTFGRISLFGVRPFAPSLDTIGWFARSPRDLGLAARALGVTPQEHGAGVPTLTIGVCRGPHWDVADPPARHALLAAADRIANTAGARVREIVLPPDLDDLTALQETIMFGEGRIAFADEASRFPNVFHDALSAIIYDRRGIPDDALRAATDRAGTLRPLFDALFGGNLSAILTLAAPGEAPRGIAHTGSSTFNRMWSVLHAPAIAIPAGTGPHGAPLGVQIIGPRGGDAGLLAAAAALAPSIDPSRDG